MNLKQCKYCQKRNFLITNYEDEKIFCSQMNRWKENEQEMDCFEAIKFIETDNVICDKECHYYKTNQCTGTSYAKDNCLMKI